MPLIKKVSSTRSFQVMARLPSIFYAIRRKAHVSNHSLALQHAKMCLTDEKRLGNRLSQSRREAGPLIHSPRPTHRSGTSIVSMIASLVPPSRTALSLIPKFPTSTAALIGLVTVSADFSSAVFIRFAVDCTETNELAEIDRFCQFRYEDATTSFARFSASWIASEDISFTEMPHTHGRKILHCWFLKKTNKNLQNKNQF
ncbi:hypothetical protein Tcan_01646, partial [Toxocara canis]